MANAPLWRGPTTLKEQTDSPEWDFEGNKTTVTRRFRGPFADCLATKPLQGAFATGNYQGLVINKVNVKKEKGGIGTLTFIMEGVLRTTDEPEDVQLPADECAVEPDKQEFALEEHPRYDLLDDTMKDTVRAYINAHNDEDRQKYYPKIVDDAVAFELAFKLRRGQTHFALFPPVYRWVIHSWLEPVCDAGGYPQTPYGPVAVPSGMEWLRCADKLNWNGTHWQLTRMWLGSFIVDTDIYPVVA